MSFVKYHLIFFSFLFLFTSCDGEILEKLDTKIEQSNFCPFSERVDGKCPGTIAADSAPVANNISPLPFNEGVEKIITFNYTDVESDKALSCSTSSLSNITISTACSCSAGVCSVGVTSSFSNSGPAGFSYTVTANSKTSNTATASLAINRVVDQLDDDDSVTGFGGGTHTGTAYIGNVLTLNATTNYAELDESWTPQWGSLIANWKMDEASWNGTANEVKDSIGSNHGVGVGNATTTNFAKVGSFSGVFNGAGDEVTLPNSLEIPLNSQVSVCFWYFLASTDVNNSGAFSFGNEESPNRFHFLFWSDGGVYWDYGNDSAGGRISVSFSNYLNRWTHVCGTSKGNGGDFKGIYLDGLLVASQSSSDGPDIALSGGVIGRSIGLHGNIKAKIDDLSLWTTSLTFEEIALIHSRQSAKYAGEMKSRIIDSQSTSSTWTNIDWITTLPFGKELPDGGDSESSADYTSLSNDSLMDGIVGLWHFNEPIGTSGVGSIKDKSGQMNHGTPSNITFDSLGIFSKAVQFSGNSSVSIPTSNGMSSLIEMTISAWVYFTVLDGSQDIIIDGGGDVRFRLNINADFPGCSFGDGTGWNQGSAVSDVKIETHRWYHLVCTINQDFVTMVVDGDLKKSNVTGSMRSIGTPSSSSIIGNYSGGAGYYINAYLDEVAIWNRALSFDEVRKLYRRGANRIKYQVRSCITPDCSDQSSEEGLGWQGPGGNYLTYFSELYNNSSISSTCVIPQKCFASELSLNGDVQTELPSIFFDDFGSPGVVVNKRYFQYRVIMESDDENTACAGGTTCMPELKSVEIGPAHTYEQ